MVKNSLHWMDRKPDPNIRVSAFNTTRHIHRPCISADTIVKMMELKSKLLGKKLSILNESEKFSEEL